MSTLEHIFTVTVVQACNSSFCSSSTTTPGTTITITTTTATTTSTTSPSAEAKALQLLERFSRLTIVTKLDERVLTLCISAGLFQLLEFLVSREQMFGFYSDINRCGCFDKVTSNNEAVRLSRCLHKEEIDYKEIDCKDNKLSSPLRAAVVRNIGDLELLKRNKNYYCMLVQLLQ